MRWGTPTRMISISFASSVPFEVRVDEQVTCRRVKHSVRVVGARIQRVDLTDHSSIRRHFCEGDGTVVETSVEQVDEVGCRIEPSHHVRRRETRFSLVIKHEGGSPSTARTKVDMVDTTARVDQVGTCSNGDRIGTTKRHNGVRAVAKRDRDITGHTSDPNIAVPGTRCIDRDCTNVAVEDLETTGEAHRLNVGDVDSEGTSTIQIQVVVTRG